MNVKVIEREWNKTLEDIHDEYSEAVKEFSGKYGKYEEVEINYRAYIKTIISDSKEIHNMSQEDLEDLALKHTPYVPVIIEEKDRIDWRSLLTGLEEAGVEIEIA